MVKMVPVGIPGLALNIIRENSGSFSKIRGKSNG